MGQFRFAVPPDQMSRLSMWDSAYICGIEGVPWEGKVTFEDGVLSIDRAVDESGRLYVPYPVLPSGPQCTLSTCSLRQTGTVRTPGGGAAPHQLALELARGECFRLRNLADVWRRAGLQLSAEQLQAIDAATSSFLRAASLRGDGDLVAGEAEHALRDLLAAGDQLARIYNEQAINYRLQNERQLGTLMGAVAHPSAMQQTLSGGPLEQTYQQAFNSIGVPLGWGEVENQAGRVDFTEFDALIAWATSNGLRVVAGPLLNFQSKLVPDWVYLYENDFQALVESVETYVEQTVLRYQGQVQLWHAVAGLNTAGPLRLDEEQVMRLAVAVIHTIRRVDPRTPVLISVDRPWGEYLGAERDGISPLHFADALIRSNLGVSGVGLELRMNYDSIGSLPRSLLDFGQQIDRWANLGLPLLVQLAFPASSGPDPRAVRPCEVIPTGSGNATTPELQADLAEQWIRTMLAKGVVHGVLWEGWDERGRHIMPHSGLIDPAGKPRPLLERLTKLRTDLLS